MKNFLCILTILLLISCKTSTTATQQSANSITKSTPQKTEILSETPIDLAEETQGPDIIPETPVVTKTKEEAQVDQTPDVQTKETLKPPMTHATWNRLVQKYITPEGNVDYKGFKNSYSSFISYLAALSKNSPNSSWSKKDKLAYWMNTYNAYTVKLILKYYPVKSIKDIKKPWDFRFIQVGKKWYTLNDVEHKILRKMGDPRIHFGINCASFSCPSLPNKAFTGQNVNQMLESLTTAFVNDPKHNELAPSEIKISKIFQWFAKDFKTNGTVIDFLNKYSKVTINANAQKKFKDYNWALNE